MNRCNNAAKRFDEQVAEGFDKIVAELRALRARVAELEDENQRLRQHCDECLPSLATEIAGVQYTSGTASSTTPAPGGE